MGGWNGWGGWVGLWVCGWCGCMSVCACVGACARGWVCTGQTPTARCLVLILTAVGHCEVAGQYGSLLMHLRCRAGKRASGNLLSGSARGRMQLTSDFVACPVAYNIYIYIYILYTYSMVIDGLLYHSGANQHQQGKLGVKQHGIAEIRCPERATLQQRERTQRTFSMTEHRREKLKCKVGLGQVSIKGKPPLRPLTAVMAIICLTPTPTLNAINIRLGNTCIVCQLKYPVCFRCILKSTHVLPN